LVCSVGRSRTKGGARGRARGGKTKGGTQSCASGENGRARRVFAKSASGCCCLSLQSQRAFKLAILLWCMGGWQCDFRCFLAHKVKAIPSQRDRCLFAGSRFTLWRSLFLLRSESVCVPMCKASDRKCVLSLFGDAVSALYVPFQSDHKVMAHTTRSVQMAGLTPLRHLLGWFY
jgi:hypothetical protein